jgi:hypothetical protein
MKRSAAAFLALGLLAAVAGGWWLLRNRTSAWRPALTAREIATRTLAAHLAERFPKSKLLVLANPFAQEAGQSPEIYEFHKAGIRGLEQIYNAPGALAVAYPELRADFHRDRNAVYIDPKTTTPLSFLVAEEALDRLIHAHPGFDLVVSLIGLPVNIRESPAWRSPENPRFALLLPDWRMVGDREAIRHAFKSGKIVAAVVNRPGAPGDEVPLSADHKSEFAGRFFLVTGDNIDELLQNFPQQF